MMAKQRHSSHGHTMTGRPVAAVSSYFATASQDAVSDVCIVSQFASLTEKGSFRGRPLESRGVRVREPKAVHNALEALSWTGLMRKNCCVP